MNDGAPAEVAPAPEAAAPAEGTPAPEAAPAEGEAAAPAAESAPTEDYDAKIANLYKRQQDMEKSSRKLQRELAERDKELEEHRGFRKEFSENTWELLQREGKDLNEFTAHYLESNIPNEEEKATAEYRGKIDALEAELKERKEAESKAESKRSRDEHITILQGHLNDSEDFPFLKNMKMAPTLYQRWVDFGSEHGELTEEDQLQEAQKFEEQTKTHVENLLGDLKDIPHFREMIAKLLNAEGDGEKPSDPDASPTSDKGEVDPTDVRALARSRKRPNTITQEDASEVGERQAQKPRTYREQRDALIKRLEAG